jgi:hypothetical protein
LLLLLFVCLLCFWHISCLPESECHLPAFIIFCAVTWETMDTDVSLYMKYAIPRCTITHTVSLLHTSATYLQAIVMDILETARYHLCVTVTLWSSTSSTSACISDTECLNYKGQSQWDIS